MDQKTLQSKVQALQNLAQNPGTPNEGLAARKAIERLRQRLVDDPPSFEHGIDYEAVISEPVFQGIRTCPWKNQIFYAMACRYGCIQFVTWEDRAGKKRTDQLYKHYLYGSERNTRLATDSFRSLVEQINHDAKLDDRNRYQQEHFKNGIADELFNVFVPPGVQNSKIYSTTTASIQTIRDFCAKNKTSFSFSVTRTMIEESQIDSKSTNLGKEGAKNLSLDPLLTKPTS